MLILVAPQSSLNEWTIISLKGQIVKPGNDRGGAECVVTFGGGYARGH
jgi:hypothetical protein